MNILPMDMAFCQSLDEKISERGCSWRKEIDLASTWPLAPWTYKMF